MRRVFNLESLLSKEAKHKRVKRSEGFEENENTVQYDREIVTTRDMTFTVQL